MPAHGEPWRTETAAVRTATNPPHLLHALVADHAKALLTYAEMLTNDRHTAEDIVQEALIRAWPHAERLTSTAGSVRGWLLTVVRNIVLDQIRARNRRPPEVRESPPDAAVEDDHAERVVNSMVVVNALSHLSAEHRAVLEQVYLKGNTVTEAAEALGIPPGTVKSRSYYALRALREAGRERLAS